MNSHNLILHLWFSRVLVGLDEDLADADVLAHGPQGGLHGLSCPQDRHAGDLRRRGRGASAVTESPEDTLDWKLPRKKTKTKQKHHSPLSRCNGGPRTRDPEESELHTSVRKNRKK